MRALLDRRYAQIVRSHDAVHKRPQSLIYIGCITNDIGGAHMCSIEVKRITIGCLGRAKIVRTEIGQRIDHDGAICSRGVDE